MVCVAMNCPSEIADRFVHLNFGVGNLLFLYQEVEELQRHWDTYWSSGLLIFKLAIKRFLKYADGDKLL